MVFRRFVEAFTPIQCKTSLFRWTILYVTALASQVIWVKCQHMTRPPAPSKKKMEGKQPAALVLNYSFWKALWYSILEAWKTTTRLSANCRNCTGKIGLRWLCLQIVFLVCLPRPTVPEKCSTERWPIREVDCTTQTNPLQKTSEARSRKKAKMVDWDLENPEGPFWKIRSISVHNYHSLIPNR